MSDTASRSSSNPEKDGPSEKPLLYFGTLIALAALWIWLGFKLQSSEIGDLPHSNLPIHWLIWTMGIIHFVEGYRTIDANERTGILILGIWTWELPPGPILAPWGISKLVRYPATFIQREFPGPPEKIYHGHDDIVPPGLVPPIRIPFAHPTIGTDGKATNGIPLDDPLNIGTTNEVSWFVAVQIGKGQLGRFYVNSGGLGNAFAQIEDVGTAQINATLTRQTPREALMNQEKNNEAVTEHIRKLTQAWGVTLNATIKQIGISLKLNTDILAVPQGLAKGQTAANRALGEKAARITKGEGDAGYEKAVQVGRAQGQAEAAQLLGITGGQLVAAQTAQEIGSSSSTTVIAGTEGFSQLLAAGTAIASTLANNRERPPTIEGAPETPQNEGDRP